MPLMFLLTGATSWLSLGQRSLTGYGMTRVRRLLLPLIAGIVILTPLQWWLAAAIARGGENPLNTIAWFFGGMRFEPTSRWFGDYGMHLWFIAFLLAYSILLPAAARRAAPPGGCASARLAGVAAHPAMLVILFAPILLSQWLLRIPTPSYRDWADFALWFGFFVVGVILVADQRLLNAVVRNGPRLIGIGVALVAGGVAVVGVALAIGLVPAGEAGNLQRLETAPVLDVPSLGYITLRTAAGAALTGGCLWIGVRRFRSQPAWLPRANRAILPFYVLYHPVAVAVSAVVVQWSMGLWAKLAVILAVSLAGTLGLTELAMRTRVGRCASSASRRMPRAALSRLSRQHHRPPTPSRSTPAQTLSLPEAERHRSVVGALAGDRAPAAHRPRPCAGRTRADGSASTYAELWNRIRATSLALQQRGVGAGDHVVIISRSRPEWVVADFAAQALGAVVCPIYPGESDARIEQIARGLRPRLLFVEDERQLSRFGDIAPTVVLGTPTEDGARVVTLADVAADRRPPGCRRTRSLAGGRGCGWIGPEWRPSRRPLMKRASPAARS